MQKDVLYKISIWSLQATTQKKRGLPSQTKYTIRERGNQRHIKHNTQVDIYLVVFH